MIEIHYWRPRFSQKKCLTGAQAQLGAAPPFAQMLAQALPDIAVVVRPVLSRPSSGFSFADIAGIAQAAMEAAEGDGHSR